MPVYPLAIRNDLAVTLDFKHIGTAYNPKNRDGSNANVIRTYDTGSKTVIFEYPEVKKDAPDFSRALMAIKAAIGGTGKTKLDLQRYASKIEIADNTEHLKISFPEDLLKPIFGTSAALRIKLEEPFDIAKRMGLVDTGTLPSGTFEPKTGTVSLICPGFRSVQDMKTAKENITSGLSDVIEAVELTDMQKATITPGDIGELVVTMPQKLYEAASGQKIVFDSVSLRK